MTMRFGSLFLLAALALAGAPACRPADAATLLKSSPPRSSGAAFGTDAQFLADAQSVLGTGVLTDSRFLELDDPNTYDITNGNNPAVRDDAFLGGVLSMPNPGTGTAYLFGKNLVPSVAGNKVIPNPSTVPWAVGFRIAIKGTIVSGTTIWLANLTSNVDDQLGIKVIGATSTTVLQTYVDGTASGSGHGVSTGSCNAYGTIGVATNNFVAPNFHRFMEIFNPTTGVVSYTVDGNVACTLTPGGNMPTKAMSPDVLISATVGMIKVDSMFWAWQANPS